jgi:hypothetical protein
MKCRAVRMFLYSQKIEYRNEWLCCTYVSILSEHRIQKKNDHAVGIAILSEHRIQKKNDHAVCTFLYCQNIEYRKSMIMLYVCFYIVSTKNK